MSILKEAFNQTKNRMKQDAIKSVSSFLFKAITTTARNSVVCSNKFFTSDNATHAIRGWMRDNPDRIYSWKEFIAIKEVPKKDTEGFDLTTYTNMGFLTEVGESTWKVLHVSKSLFIFFTYSNSLEKPENDSKNGLGEANHRHSSGDARRATEHVEITYFRAQKQAVREWLTECIIAEKKVEDEYRENQDSEQKWIDVFTPDTFTNQLREVSKNSNQQLATSLTFLNYSNGVKEHMIKILDTFKKASSKYAKMGRKHTKGILLYGPPGTGKTTLVKAVAAYTRRNLLTINLGSMTEDAFNKLSASLTKHSDLILVFEDVDSVYEKRRAIGESKDPVRFETFLNFLQGLLSPENTIIILTANNPEKLDTALIRKGRIDEIICVHPWTEVETLEYLTKLFELDSEQKAGLKALLPAGNYKPQDVEKYGMDNFESYAEFLTTLPNLIKDSKSIEYKLFDPNAVQPEEAEDLTEHNPKPKKQKKNRGFFN